MNGIIIMIIGTMLLTITMLLLVNTKMAAGQEESICSDVNFETAVTINECYALLFNKNFFWLLDICNFKLMKKYHSKQILTEKCTGNNNNKVYGNVKPDVQFDDDDLIDYEKHLYVWKHHYEPYRNYICMEHVSIINVILLPMGLVLLFLVLSIFHSYKTPTSTSTHPPERIHIAFFGADLQYQKYQKH